MTEPELMSTDDLLASRAAEFESDLQARQARAEANAARFAADAPADGVPDVQVFGLPWTWQRVNVTPGHLGTVDLTTGEASVGLGLYLATAAAGGSAEMGGPFRLPGDANFEFRTTLDHNFDWWFSTAAGGADSQGWLSIIVDELLDAPGSTWHSVVNRRIQLWSDETGSAASDGATDPGSRTTIKEPFRGRPDAQYIWWLGANATIQTEFQASSQANLTASLHNLIFIART